MSLMISNPRDKIIEIKMRHVINDIGEKISLVTLLVLLAYSIYIYITNTINLKNRLFINLI